MGEPGVTVGGAVGGLVGGLVGDLVGGPVGNFVGDPVMGLSLGAMVVGYQSVQQWWDFL